MFFDIDVGFGQLGDCDGVCKNINSAIVYLIEQEFFERKERSLPFTNLAFEEQSRTMRRTVTKQDSLGTSNEF